ncbi:hypothetical protein GNE08_04390 [Trichormus variabilis ARAD]|nr:MULTISPECIES: hypothetical protein [Nostocaceae]MBC1213457.1 hypothetical protein [Trichormus variabilis ARAD]MBC1256739.1 hypothetical protein [Trichormus variabilis V5]MBC1266478.1 hypothetical protein [Trichormus variabilis FSR]MBC1301948.1 hypothetical protein [Trichormus variabilis N2B]MBC1310696.1 hypothetical protein [Trichormus variabilis PNB]
MALAQHISIQDDTRVNLSFSSKISQTVITLYGRLWWHTKAYTTVFGMIFLVLASLGFLSIYWFGKKLTQGLQPGTVAEQK